MVEGVKRKISAILKADAVGYSRLMRADEATTIDRVSSYRELIENRILEHNGRMVDSPGDEILAEFPAALDATRCAAEIQQALKNRNVDLSEDRRMEFRIGIHTGDVRIDGDRVYGDTVNIAARLEELAEPSGICVSGAIYDQIRNKLDLGFVKIGKKKVKNISEPILVYRIQQASKSISPSILRLTAYAAAIVLCLISAIAWYFLLGNKTPLEPHFSEKPSIAVLPFDNLSGDPEQEYFSDGISGDLINGLAKNSRIDVIARTSSFRFRGHEQDIRSICKQLNATHVLEGSVQKSGNQIRITAQLIDADKGTYLWSEQFNREMTDVFDIQDEITSEILKILKIRLSSLDEKFQTVNMEAYNAYLLGRSQFDQRQMEKAIAFFEKAVSLDPGYADAYGMLALMHNHLIWIDLFPASEKLPLVRSYIEKALSLNSNQIEAQIVREFIRFAIDREYQKAMINVGDLARKYPSNKYCYYAYWLVFQSIGRLDLALKSIDRVLELDPLSPRAHSVRGMVLYLAGRFDESRQSYEMMEALGWTMPLHFATLAFSLNDAEGIQKELDRGREAWRYSGEHYAFFEAAIAYLRGDHEGVRKILNLVKHVKKYTGPYTKASYLLIEGNIDLALDHVSEALAESPYTVLLHIQTHGIFRHFFPEYRSHPKHQKMLRDVGLDEESIAILEIPPLPF